MICRHTLLRLRYHGNHSNHGNHSYLLRYTNHRYISSTVTLRNKHPPLEATNQTTGQALPDLAQPVTIPDPAISETISEAVVVQPGSDSLIAETGADTVSTVTDTVSTVTDTVGTVTDTVGMVTDTVSTVTDTVGTVTDTVVASGETVQLIARGAKESGVLEWLWDLAGTGLYYVTLPMKTTLGWMGSFFGTSASDLSVPLLAHAPAKLTNLYIPWCLDHFQALTGTPWIFLCIATTILIRAALWKVTLGTIRGAYSLPVETKKMELLQSNIKFYSDTKQMEKLQAAQQKLKEVKVTGFFLLTSLNAFLMMVPIRSTFASLKNLEGLTHNEYGWIPDLTQPDPYYILPSIVVCNLVVIGLVNFRNHKYFNERTGSLGLLGAGGMVWLLSGTPAVMMQHYAISSTVTSMIHLARENEALRIKLGLPPTEQLTLPPSTIPTVYHSVETEREAGTTDTVPVHAPERVMVEKSYLRKSLDRVSKTLGVNLREPKKKGSGTIGKIQHWFYLRKLKRHAAKGVTTEFLEERPALPRFAPEPIQLVTEVTPELKEYVTRRKYNTKTLQGTLDKIEYMKRVQNIRW